MDIKELISGYQNVVAIFDIDKTVLPGYSIIDFASDLTTKEKFSPLEWAKIENFILEYKKDGDYNKFADEVVEAYSRGISGQVVEQIEALSSEFWQGRIGTVFPFILSVFAQLDEVNATKIAISGSSLESLNPLLQFLGFDQTYTTLVETKNGKYASNVLVNAASHEQKAKIVSEVMAQIPVSTITLGFGDSIADHTFLSLVTHPVVMGTHDEELVSIARLNGWMIEASHEGGNKDV